MNPKSSLIQNIQELENDTIVQEWFLTLNPKPKTKKNYLQSMQKYCNFTGKTPTAIINEAEDEVRSGKLMRERSIKHDLIRFRAMMQDDGLAPLTVKGHMTGVRSFYRCLDVELPTLPRTGNKARPLEKHNKIPVKDDIREVLEHADELGRAVVLTEVSSGLASAETRFLTVGQFKKGYDPKTGITTLHLRREKAEFDFITFLTPEASKAIWDYLKFRDREPKNADSSKRDMLAKQRVYSDNDYLFINRQNKSEYLDPEYDAKHKEYIKAIKSNDKAKIKELKNYKHADKEKLRQFSEQGIQKLYEAMSEDTQKDAPKGVWNLVRSHNMRKFFNSALLNAGCDSFHVEFWMGHTLDDTKAAYFRANADKMRDLYAKYVPYLTIEKSLDVSESEEFMDAQAELLELRADNERHKVEHYQLMEFSRQMQSQQATLNTLGRNFAAQQRTINELIKYVDPELVKKIELEAHQEAYADIYADDGSEYAMALADN